jgi:hypothetical protein
MTEIFAERVTHDCRLANRCIVSSGSSGRYRPLAFTAGGLLISGVQTPSFPRTFDDG